MTDSQRTVFEHPDLNAPEFVRTSALITSVRVETKFGHDHVTVFNRGGGSGTLVVREGDGAEIAARLLPQRRVSIEHVFDVGGLTEVRREAGT